MSCVIPYLLWQGEVGWWAFPPAVVEPHCESSSATFHTIVTLLQSEVCETEFFFKHMEKLLLCSPGLYSTSVLKF